MKKRVVLSIVTILCAALVMVVLFSVFKKEPFDVVLETLGESTVFTLEKISYPEPQSFSDFGESSVMIFSSDKQKTYQKIADLDCFLYSFSGRNHAEDTSLNSFLLYQNGHYFVMRKGSDSDKRDAIVLSELITCVEVPRPENGDVFTGYLYLPMTFSTRINLLEFSSFSFGDTIGINSFDELAEFYSRIDSKYYKIDSVNRSIELRFFYKFGGSLMQESCVIKEKDTGFSLTLHLSEN